MESAASVPVGDPEDLCEAWDNGAENTPNSSLIHLKIKEMEAARK